MTPSTRTGDNVLYAGRGGCGSAAGTGRGVLKNASTKPAHAIAAKPARANNEGAFMTYPLQRRLLPQRCAARAGDASRAALARQNPLAGPGQRIADQALDQ